MKDTVDERDFTLLAKLCRSDSVRARPEEWPKKTALALQTNFGVTKETLALEFGNALGIPNVWS
jgi:hypothetical protein